MCRRFLVPISSYQFALDDDQDFPGIYAPSPAEIEAACEAIRSRWSKAELARRAPWLAEQRRVELHRLRSLEPRDARE